VQVPEDALALLTRGRPKTKESLTRQILHRCRFVGSAQLNCMLSAYVRESLSTLEELELFQREILEQVPADVLETYLLTKESPEDLDSPARLQLKAFARAFYETTGGGDNSQP